MVGAKRRKLLGTAFTVVAVPLAGCNTSGDGSDKRNQSSAENQTGTSTSSDTPTLTPGSITGTVGLKPKNPEAEYADAGVFEKYNEGDFTVELDLAAAREAHLNDIHFWDSRNPGLEQHARDMKDSDMVDWDILSGEHDEYEDDFETRYEESGAREYFINMEQEFLDEVSSTHNQQLAAFIQFIEYNLLENEDNWIWGSQVDGGHGIVNVIENMRDVGENLEEQATYIFETDLFREVSEMVDEFSDSGYKEDRETYEMYDHPAEEDYEGPERKEDNFLEKTITNTEGDDGPYHATIKFDDSVQTEFEGLFRDADSSTGPAQLYVDQAAAASALARMSQYSDGRFTVRVDLEIIGVINGTV